jgi:hypothetical protein
MPDRMKTGTPPVKRRPNYFADYLDAARRRGGGTEPGLHAQAIRAQVTTDSKPVTLPTILFLQCEGEALIGAIPLTARFVELQVVEAS